MLPKKPFWVKIMEGKDKLTKGSYSESNFEREFGSKIAVLVVRMTESLWGSVRYVMMGSGFGYME